MPDGGEARIEIYASEKEVQIKVIDHGCGIPADKLMQVGQPFFISKKTRNGPRYGVVKQGTTVKVLLPVAC